MLRYFTAFRTPPSPPLTPQDVIPEDKQPELLDTISKGNVTMRVLKDMFESVLELGPMSQVTVWGRGVEQGLITCGDAGKQVDLSAWRQAANQ